MTQHFIRKHAGLGWLKRSYLRLSEPRVISATYGGLYTVAFIVGIFDFFIIPRTLCHVTGGHLLAYLIATLLTTSGAAGAWLIVQGSNWLEKHVIQFLTLGLATHLFAVVWASIVVADGSMAHRIMGDIFGIALVLLRLHWVKDTPYRRGSKAERKATR